ncbi:MAG: hypothetical protein CM1200mP10_17430 [Candidatus Neomarinimicrobiota bacterium]|nr:MAG: hypothetical protein CM1200mP10_17430 [Candidatus Neomarinimicrobiota bacterium]
MIKIYKKSVTQFIAKPLDVVFLFFSKPENLRRITPPTLDFQILTPTPISMEKGTVIDYKIKVMGIQVHWRTIIQAITHLLNLLMNRRKGPYVYGFILIHLKLKMGALKSTIV